MVYGILVDHRAGKYLEKLPPDTGKQIYLRIKQLAANPRPAGCLKIKAPGRADAWRIRAGKYRVLYTIDDAAAEVRVYDVELRDKAYKKKS